MSKSNITASKCKICGISAVYSYYGAISCESCKMFFKRNAENRKKIFKCNFGNQCQVDILNRRICSACRLSKCLKVGMCSGMIRAPRAKQFKKTNQSFTSVQMTINREYRKSQQLPRLNLLEHDQSLLSTDQWNHLSNLIHSYDEHTDISIAKQFMKELDSLHPKLRFKIDSKKIVDVITTSYETAGSFIQSNQDFVSLSLNDRSIALRSAIDNVSCLGGSFFLRQSGLITSLAFCQGLENTYGTILYNLTLTAISLLDHDINLVKLALSLFAFCTNNYTIFDGNSSFVDLMDNQLFLRIQNIYAELIWKYLIYKYTFNQAVLRFSNIVRCFVVELTIRTHLQTVKQHTDVVDLLVQKIEQQQIDIDNN